VSAFRFSLAHGSRSRRSLSARGQFVNTFAGIGYCLSFSLLAVGGYGIEEQFANPVEAQAVGLLFSALLIATAATLLYCLLHPSRKKGHSIALWPAGTSWNEKRVVVASSAAGSEQNRMPMPLHGRYVDRTLLRIQR
jgi:hypothetical protein